MNKAAHLFDFFFLDEIERIEVLDFRGYGASKAGRVKPGDRSYAALACQEICPGLGTGVAHRANQAQSRDDDPTTQAYLPPFAWALI